VPLAWQVVPVGQTLGLPVHKRGKVVVVLSTGHDVQQPTLS
jgi:hypothetical protein